jgi:hypothetical protein
VVEIGVEVCVLLEWELNLSKLMLLKSPELVLESPDAPLSRGVSSALISAALSLRFFARLLADRETFEVPSGGELPSLTVSELSS